MGSVFVILKFNRAHLKFTVYGRKQASKQALQYQSVFQSSNLIGRVRINLGCCQGNGAYVYIAVYNYQTIGVLKRYPGMAQQTSKQAYTRMCAMQSR